MIQTTLLLTSVLITSVYITFMLVNEINNPSSTSAVTRNLIPTEAITIALATTNLPATSPRQTVIRCQRGEAYYPLTGKCYRLERKGPCGALMELEVYRVDPIWNLVGTCSCKYEMGSLFHRKLTYWNPTKRCYYAFDQGYCRRGEWLVPEEDSNQFHCERIPCPDLYNKRIAPKSEDLAGCKKERYVFAYNGTCYTQGDQEYCPVGYELYFNERNAPKCGPRSMWRECTRHLRVLTPNIDCEDGKSRDALGGCSPITLLLDYDE